MSSTTVKYVGSPNVVCSVNSGTFQNAYGTLLDLSGNGADLSGTQILKVAPFNNNKDCYYALLDLSNNTINNVDCSGFNIIRVLNGGVSGVGYIDNPSVVNAFVCDTSANLWVGGTNMTVKATYGGSQIPRTQYMFVVPRENVTAQPTAFSQVDVSGCTDIIPVKNLMVASVLDVSGACLNYADSGNTVSVDGLTFPRILDNTDAFNLWFNNDVGGAPIADKNMDLSGHRLVAFKRDGYYGNDVSGVYVVRANSNFTGTASTMTLNAASTAGVNIPSDLTFNKLGFDVSRNHLYALPGTNDKYPLIVPLDTSANVITTNYTCKNNALISYAQTTGTTAGEVDASGFMVVCTNPSVTGARPVLKLDASGAAFDTLTLYDVSGVNAMGTAAARYNNTSVYNYIYLVDASRNQIGQSQFNAKPKVAELRLSARSDNTGDYVDGSGVLFVSNFGNSDFGYSNSSTDGHSYIRDLKIDACGNIFMGGHHIYINVSQGDQQSNITGSTVNTGVSSAILSTFTSGNPVIGTTTPEQNDALDNVISVSEKIVGLVSAVTFDEFIGNSSLSGDLVNSTSIKQDLNHRLTKSNLQ
jgi:hypothetical protein